MPFDFEYDDATGYIGKVGYYSHCEPHEASREEVLLWRRAEELETLLDERCPTEVLVLLSKIPKASRHIAVSPEDFAEIRQHARHRVTMETHPTLVHRGILGSMPLLDDGSPISVYISVERGIERGEVVVKDAPV